MATWDSWLQKAKDEANNWAGKAWGVGEDVASGLEDTWHNWWNPADNPRNKTMTPEQIAWENPNVFTKPENNAVPVKQFLEQAVAGAEKPTDPKVHMLSSLRDAPVVGGAIRTGELAMNGLQALQEGLLVPMIGSLVDGIANNSFDALAGKNGQYEAAREAFYKMPLPVQLAANFVDPLQVAAGSVVGVAKLAKPLRALDDAMKVAKDAGDAAAIGRLKTLAGQVDAALKPSGLLGSSNTRMAELTVKRALPYVNHETRTVQQIAEAAANQGKYGLGPGAVKVGKNLENQYERVGVEAPTALQRIGSMLDMTKPTNSAYRSRMMDTVGELSTLISSKVKGVPEDYVNTLVDILNSPVTGKKITGYEEFTDSTRAKEMIAYMRTMASPETLKPAERIRWRGEVKPEFLDSVLTNAAKKVLGEDLSVIPTEAQKAQIGTETVGAMLRKLDETLKLYYPDQPMNPVQKVLAAFKNASATYLYMGYSPGYVARNIVSNYIPAMIDGTFSMEGAGQATKDAIRFGLTPEMMRGLGAADVGSWAMETASRGYVQALRQGGIKGLFKGPALQLGQVAEQKASVRIAVNAMKSAYNKFWSGVARPQMPEDVAQALGKNVGIVNSKIGLAVNHKELEQVLDDLSGIAGMTRVRQMGDPAILEEARKISPEFAKEVETIFRESGDKTPRQVSEAIAKLHNEKYAMRVAAEHLAEDNDVASLADKVAELGKTMSEKDSIAKGVEHAADTRRKAIDAPLAQLRAKATASGDIVQREAAIKVADERDFYETVGWWRRNKFQNLTTRWENTEDNAAMLNNPLRPGYGDGITTSADYLTKYHISDPTLKTLKATHIGRQDPRYQFIVDTFHDEQAIMQSKIDNLRSVVEKAGPKPAKVTPDMAVKLKALGHSDIDIKGMTVDQANGLIATSTKKAAEAKPVVNAALATPAKGAAVPPVQAPVQRSHVQADGAKAMNDAMAKVLADTNDWITKHWDEMGTATDTVTMAKTRAWIEDVVKPAQTQAVLASRQYGVAMRDAALHNYADRRNFDIFASYLYPFSYWYTRSGMAYMDRMVRNPALITSYVDLMQKITDMNKTLPLSWQNQIQLPGFDDNPMYVNLRTLIDPLYQSMSNAMNAAYKSGGGTVENALAQLGGWGPSLQAPLIYAMAGMGQFSDNNDWIGYQSGGLIGERPVKAMSALARSAGLGLNVIPPGGWNIEGPIRQIVSPALQTTGAMIRPAVNAVGTALLGDKFKPNTDTAALQRQDPAELTRAAKYLATEFQKGTINPETGVPITKDDMNKAMQLQSGALWDMARQLEGQASALPNLTSTLIGASVRTHDIDEQQLQNSRDEYYTKIKPLKTTDPAAYTAALNDFKARYPWYFSLSGVKYNDTPEAKQKAYETGRGYTVLMERVPPGYQAGMSAEQKALISKFFDLKGAFEQFSPTEQKAFSVLMDSLEKKYPTAPTDTEKAERAQAKAENTAYWNLPAGKERTAFKKSHPTWSKFYAGQPFVVTPKK